MTYKPVAGRRVIFLDIRTAEPGSLKVVWRANSGLGFYKISRDAVDTACTRIRKSLAHLVDAKMKDKPYVQILKDLAIAGQDLHNALFRSTDTNNTSPKSVLQGLEHANEPILISITVDAFIRVPWGLIFDGDPDQLPADKPCVDRYGAFWCLKYLAPCVHDRVQDFTAGRKTFRVFPVLHEKEFKTASAAEGIPPLELIALSVRPKRS